jgi:hypothetical protein
MAIVWRPLIEESTLPTGLCPKPRNINMILLEYEIEHDMEHEKLPWWKQFLGDLFCYPRWQAAWADCTVEVGYTVSRYYPARISGPPEDCYPAEGGEIEDWEVKLLDATIYDVEGRPIMRMADLSAQERAKIEDKISDNIPNSPLYDAMIENSYDLADYLNELLDDRWDYE